MTRDGRFRAAASVIFLLLIASLVIGWKSSRETRVHQELAQRSARRQWESQEAKNPHSAAHFGTYAFKTPAPLAYFDSGVDAYTGVAVWIEAHKQNPFLFRPAEDATGIARFGDGAAASAMQLLVPLLIILLSFSAFAGEREQGMLKQALSAGASKRDLLVGKALGQFAALGLLLVPATIIGVIALALNSAQAGDFARLSFLIAGYLVYFAGFVALALACSAWARSSRVALIVLFAFWILNCLLAPRVAADLAERLYPTPTRAQFWETIEQDMKNGVDGHNPAAQRTEELKRQALEQYGVTKVEDLPVNFAGIALQAGEEYGNRVFDRRYGELWGLYEKQNQIHKALALVAPLTALRQFSAGMAGTDFAQHRDFALAAENYRRALNKMMNEHLAYNSRGADYEYEAGSALWRETPDFVYAPPGAAWVLRRQVWNCSILALWFVVAAILAWRAAIHLKP
jgi:ABC-2 type transport system permease protein